jgi:hypothetical protein
LASSANAKKDTDEEQKMSQPVVQNEAFITEDTIHREELVQENNQLIERL